MRTNLMERVYTKCRAKGYRAESAWAMARMAYADDNMPWKDANASERAIVRQARVSYGAFDYRVRIHWDEDSSSTDFASGHFSDSWEPNAINSDEYQRAQYQYPRVRYPRRLRRRKDTHARPYHCGNYLSESRYFVPDESLKAIAKAYSKMGYARHAAWLKAWEQVRQDEALAAGKDYTAYGVSVAAYAHGTNLELAYESCWGVQVDNDEYYLTEVANELIVEACHEAQENIPHRLAELRAQVATLQTNAAANSALLESYQ